MRVLVTWGTRRGGTAGIGEEIARSLRERGHDVVAVRAERAADVRHFDAVIVGGALYANRWVPEARRFVRRNVEDLRRVPVWLFSSGPLDDSADVSEIPPLSEVSIFAQRIGAQEHRTFGGRLDPDAQGFPAAAMAKKMAGDWRNRKTIRRWAEHIADVLPTATPIPAMEPPARSTTRLLLYGLAGWAACGATMGLLMAMTSGSTALLGHAIAAPVIFAFLASRYFAAAGAREPAVTALTWTLEVAILDAAVVAALVLRSFDMFASVVGTWLPFAMIFVVTWSTGSLMATMPWSTRPRGATEAHS